MDNLLTLGVIGAIVAGIFYFLGLGKDRAKVKDLIDVEKKKDEAHAERDEEQEKAAEEERKRIMEDISNESDQNIARRFYDRYRKPRVR